MFSTDINVVDFSFWIVTASMAAATLFFILERFEVNPKLIQNEIQNSEELNKIREIALSVDKALGVHDIIMNNYGHDTYLSLHVEIDAKKTAAEAHNISEEVEMLLIKQMLKVECFY